MKVKVGQVWASTHASDREEGVRQHRVVTSIQKYPACHVVFLHTTGSKQKGAHGTKVRDLAKGIPGHRLVEDAA